jgi:hypothetical protein
MTPTTTVILRSPTQRGVSKDDPERASILRDAAQEARLLRMTDWNLLQ